MYRKLTCLSLAVVLGALAVACKRDEDVNAVMSDLNSFTQEMVKKVESAPNPSAGVDDAQKYFDSRKDEIKGKLDSIKNVREAQVSEETKKKMMERVTEDAMSVAKLKVKYISNSMRDPAFSAKLDKLINDYQSLLKLS